MKYILIILIACTMGCGSEKKSKYKTTGSIEQVDPALDSILSKKAKIEIIAEGMEWSEGPLWIENQQMLLWSDVPGNTIYKWTEEKGKEVYLTPSGYTSEVKRAGEMGSNGLALDRHGRLVLCQHGNRQVAVMDAATDKPEAKFTTLAGLYNGKRFNSPNDAVYSVNGDLYFTDPPYGLEKQMDDPGKEIAFQGVYCLHQSGYLTLITDQMSRPNGLGMFPNSYELLVSNSDPQKPEWWVYYVGAGDTLVQPRLFYSVTGYDKALKGLPDGLKIDRNGTVFATAPGGLLILNRQGKLLGKIKLGEATSNCALSPDEKTLYITNDMQVLRIKMRD